MNNLCIHVFIFDAIVLQISLPGSIKFRPTLGFCLLISYLIVTDTYVIQGVLANAVVLYTQITLRLLQLREEQLTHVHRPALQLVLDNVIMLLLGTK